MSEQTTEIIRNLRKEVDLQDATEARAEEALEQLAAAQAALTVTPCLCGGLCEQCLMQFIGQTRCPGCDLTIPLSAICDRCKALAGGTQALDAHDYDLICNLPPFDQMRLDSSGKYRTLLERLEAHDAEKDRRIVALEAALQSEVDNYHAEGDGGYVFDDDTAECCACGAVHTKRSDDEDCHRMGCVQRIHERSEDVLAGGHSALDAALEKAREEGHNEATTFLNAQGDSLSFTGLIKAAQERDALVVHCARLKEEFLGLLTRFVESAHQNYCHLSLLRTERTTLTELCATEPTDSLAAIKQKVRREIVEQWQADCTANQMDASSYAVPVRWLLDREQWLRNVFFANRAQRQNRRYQFLAEHRLGNRQSDP